MSFEQPLWLALLAALPVLWWLHRQRRGPRVLRVSSVAPFRAAADEPTAARPRRRVDVPLLLLLAATTALALAAAGPSIGAERPRVYVVVDNSASMAAGPPAGPDVGTDALRRARGLLRDVTEVAHPLIEPDADAGRRDPLAPVATVADGLPGSLAPHLAAARAQGFPGVLLVTDRALALPGVVVVGPSTGAGPNFGIADAVLDGDEMIVSVRSTADTPTDVTLQWRSGRRVARVPARGVATLRLPALRGADPEHVAIEVDDALEWDDAAAVVRVGGARTATLRGSPPFDRLRRALVACGVEVVERRADVDVFRGGSPRAPGAGRLLQFAAAPGHGGQLSVSSGGARQVPGRALQGRGPLGSGLPSAAAAVVATGRIDGGTPALVDGDGSLAVSSERAVVTCLDPEDPASTWHEEPSFPVFVAAALEHVAGRDRVELLAPVPASEIEVADAPVPLPSAAQVRALQHTGGGRSLAPGLAVLAACLVLGALLAGLLVGRPRSIRVPRWGAERAR